MSSRGIANGKQIIGLSHHIACNTEEAPLVLLRNGHFYLFHPHSTKWQSINGVKEIGLAIAGNYDETILGEKRPVVCVYALFILW